MAEKPYLGGLEELLLLSVIALGDNAYGTTVIDYYCTTLGRSLSVGAAYTVLGRLEAKGFLTSSLSDPRDMRGGRVRRMYLPTDAGNTALYEAERVRSALRAAAATPAEQIVV